MRLKFALGAVFLFAAQASSAEIEIATWNIAHLRPAEGTGSIRREKEDYERLQQYAGELDADVIALQEVDGAEAAARVFSSDAYNFYFSERNNVQRTGFAVRKTLTVTHNPDLSELGIDGNLRHGTDITVHVDGTPLRLLSVHLKSGCFSQDLSNGSRACRRLKSQVPVLESWIDDRATEGAAFAILGDFNRRFDEDENIATPGESLWNEIDDGTPTGLDLSRINAGLTSQCWNGEFPVYIDHLVVNNLAANWVVEGSFDQIVYQMAHTAHKQELSDHCAISAKLDIPSGEMFALSKIMGRNSAGDRSALTATGSNFASGDSAKLNEILKKLQAIEDRMDAMAAQ